jgi:transposase
MSFDMGMKRHNRVTFKPHTMNQPTLLPPSLEELIPEKHLVRVVNRVVDRLNIDPLIQQYAGGGASSYHPAMMLKVLIYCYTQQIYSSRQIARALRENVNLMWLSGNNRPDFRTINRFRSEKMKAVIDQVFTAVLQYLVEAGYVKLEDYFVDGTTVAANANKFRVVWAKQTERYKAQVEATIKELLESIEAANEAEDQEYGEHDLPEVGEQVEEGLDSEKLKKKIDELNRRLEAEPENKEVRKGVQKLEREYLPRQQKYEQQEVILGGRGSYARGDEDASSMLLKEDKGPKRAWPKPAYNVQMGTEGQFVVGFSIHQNAADSSCFIEHLERVKEQCGRLPNKVVADAGYGSEENYHYLEENQVVSYVKYNSYHREKKKHRKPELKRRQRFRGESFTYDEEQNQFICPEGKPLTWLGSRKRLTSTGYETEQRIYECAECDGCPSKADCTQAKGNRRLYESPKTRRYREQARLNLESEEGQRLRSQRGIEVEAVFGMIKHNMRFRRFLLRGKEKVKIEWGLLSMAHNMKKLAAA